MIFKSHHAFRSLLIIWLAIVDPLVSQAAVPQLLNHQGRVAVNGVNFQGSGQFKFALVNADGSVTYWSNNGTSSVGSQPTLAVTLPVTKGLYSVLLGDTTLANMSPLPSSALEHEQVRLRIWFNDGNRGFQQLAPDQRLAAAPFALLATKSTAFTGPLAGDVTGTQAATSIAAETVTGKPLTGYLSVAGTLSASDSILSAINKLNGNDALKANSDSPTLANPTFTGTVGGITKSMVGLGNVDNISDADKPVSTAQLAALAEKADTTALDTAITDFATAVDAKADIAALATKADATALDAKAPLASPTFTGTVGGLSKSMVGLGNVDNISDADKPVSTAQQAALNLKANLASPAFTGTVLLPAGSNTSAPLQLATGTSLTTPAFGSVEFDGTNLFLTNNSASPTRKVLAFTDAPALTGVPLAPTAAAGTNTEQIATTQFVQSAIQGVVGAAPAALDTLNELAIALNNDASYASTITNALSLKAPLASPTFTGTTTGTFSGPLTGNVTGNVSGSAASFTGSLVGDVTGIQSATVISAPTVTGKTLTGYVSGAGTLSATDTILSAINKLNGNDALKANLASPTFTGTVGGITASMVGLGNVSNISDANKPVSTAQQTALNLKANLASPTFTGTVAGITASMVGLGNVNNTSDAAKPVSTFQQEALNLKANLASPSFSGTVSLPTGTALSAPMMLTAGTNLTSASFGAVEFDGTNLYLTTNAASPTRKTVALSDTGSSSQIGLSSVVAAPLYPVVAWGDNSDGQARAPVLANVAAVAAGNSHSIALLDDGQVVEWGRSVGGTKPALTGVTDIAAGGSHNLVRQSNGRVFAWGNNTYGQSTAPTDILTAVKVAAGARHSLALLANGTVRGWGEDYLGKNAAPASLTGVTVIAIAAGQNHSLALKSNGGVVAWGDNAASQTTVPDGALSGVTAIAAGWNHNLALKLDGSVVAWGHDAGGKIDVPTAAASGVVQIAAGDTYSMALKADGTIVTWGFRAVANPVTVVPEGTTQVTQIAAGGDHALALRADSVPAQLARLDSAGRLGIGRTPLLNALEVEGNASKNTAGSWLANSDRRIKTDIESITGALDKLDQVRLVDFRYTDEYLAAHPGIEDRRYPNVIAQEFQKVFPDDVKGSGETLPDGSEILQVDTYALTIYSAAAVQELHRENRELKHKLAEQEQRLRKLERALTGK